MDVEEIIERLNFYDGTFPRQALKEAMARREQVTPVLLQILEELLTISRTFTSRKITWLTSMPCSCWLSSVKSAHTRWSSISSPRRATSRWRLPEMSSPNTLIGY